MNAFSTSENKYGVALVVSGASGSGKSTACGILREQEPELAFSISCTTRKPRAGEEHGREYWFVDDETFRKKIDAGEFLEYAEVHGCWYGTPRTQVENHLNQGKDVLLDVDIEGGRRLRQCSGSISFSTRSVDVFFAPPSLQELERRLRKRGTEEEVVIRRRLENARREMAAWREYQYLVINDDLMRAVRDLQTILQASRQRTAAYKRPPWEVNDESE